MRIENRTQASQVEHFKTATARKAHAVGFAAAIVVSGLFGIERVQAANAAKVVNFASSDLSAAGSYTASGLPTANIDVELQAGTYSNKIFTTNGASLAYGSLDNFNVTQNLVISNANAAASLITITNGGTAGTSGGTNSVAATNDVIYVASSANLTIQNGAGNSNIAITGANNIAIENNGVLNVNGGLGNPNGKTISFTGSGATTVGGVLSGSGIFNANMTGSAGVTLSGQNTFTGTIQTNTGVLNLNSTLALGTGSLLFNSLPANATIDNTTAGAVVLSGTNAISTLNTNNYGITFGGTNNLNLGGGAFSVAKANGIVLNSTRKTLTFGTWTNTTNSTYASSVNNGSGASNNTVVFGGMLLNNASGGGTQTQTFNGSGNVTVTGAVNNGASGSAQNLAYSGSGVFTLAGANNYTGTTAVSGGGTLNLKNSGALNASAGAVSVAGGSGLQYIAGADAQLTMASTFTLGGGVGTVIGGSIGSTTTSAAIKVNGNALTASNANAVKVNIYGMGVSATTSGSGAYTLIQGGAAGATTLNTANYTLGTVYNNSNFTVGALAKSTTALTVAITTATALTDEYWTGTATAGLTSVWAASNGTTTSNWSVTAGGTVQALTPGSTAVVHFAASPVVAPTATTLGADMTVDSLSLEDTSNGLTLLSDGNTLTLKAASGTGITVNSGVPGSTIGANVALGASQTWTNNSANALTVSGNISGGNNLTLAGPVVLSGGNSYTGTTTVSSGTLRINGTHLGGTGYSVSNGATLAGSGFINSAGGNSVTIASGGKLSPGSVDGTIGTLTIGTGGLDLTGATGGLNTGELQFDLGANLTGDKVALGTGTLSFATGLDATDFALSGSGITVGQYVLFDTNNAIGNVASISTASATFSNGITGNLLLANGNQDLVLNVTAIPEPATCGVLLMGATGLLARRRKNLA